MSEWINNDGLLVRYGLDQGVRGDKAGVTTGAGKERELVATITLTGAARTTYTADLNNDGTDDGFTGMDNPIPSGALIQGFDIVTIETPAGGTNYTLGTFQKDGDAIDADGIRVTAGTAGAQVGTVIAEDGYLAAVTTGTYTAGIIQVVVRYVTV